MEYINIKNKVIEKRAKYELDEMEHLYKIKTLEDLKRCYYYKYITKSKAKQDFNLQFEFIINKFKIVFVKETKDILQRIDDISKATPTKNIKIEVNWKYSKAWGNSPQAELRSDYNFYISKRIGGCGYDKLSASTADVLNLDNSILCYLYDAFENALIIDNNATLEDILGYGSGCGYMPEFESGVGVKCHIHMLKKVGFEVEYDGGREWDLIKAKII